MIPNILHFVFGMAPDFGGKPFSLVHYLAIRSAVIVNQPDAVYFHYEYEPEGEWWQRAKPALIPHHIKAPGEFMGRTLHHVAHRADVVRLQALYEMGGVYMDLDTISVRPLSPLLNNHFVIGQEEKIIYRPKNLRQKVKYKFWETMGAYKNRPVHTGLCNAVLLAEKNSMFTRKWLDSYSSFRAVGHDKYWNEHSVQVPEKLAAELPGMVTQLHPRAFHYPLFNEAGLRAMFEEVHHYPEAYLHHLWESFSWKKYLSALSVDMIMNVDTTYNMIARRFI